MTEPCAEWSRDLAGLALGALGPDEQVAVAAHVEGCADCAGALADLLATVAVLDRADADRLDDVSLPPRGLDSRVLDAVERERVRARRRTLAVRWGLAAAAAALVVAGTGAVLTSRQPSPVPVGEVVALAAASGQGDLPPAVTATITAKAWGTAVDLEVTGSTPGVVYRVWVADEQGVRTSAGSFMGASRTLTVAAAAGLARGEATVVGVSTDDGDPLVVAELPAPPEG